MAQLAVDFGAAGYKVRAALQGVERLGRHATAVQPAAASALPAQLCTWSRAIWGLARKRSGMPSPIPREM